MSAEIIDRESHWVYKDKMTKLWTFLYRDMLNLEDYAERVEHRLERGYGKKGIERLRQFTDIEGKYVLDSGCGCGEFVLESLLAGMDPVGIEPDDNFLECAELLLKSYGFDPSSHLVKSKGENTPFDDNIFDLIISNSVIEHVDDPSQYLDEMIRVMKPESLMWLKCPNYLHPYERHYKRYYPFFLPDRLVQLYFNLITGNNTNNFYTFNRITPFFVKKKLQTRDDVDYRDLSEEESSGLFRSALAYIQMYPQIELLIKKV